MNLGEVPHTAQKSVGNSRRAARAQGDLARSVVFDTYIQDAGGASNDRRKLLRSIEVQMEVQARSGPVGAS